jgi:hypothetical protein
MKDDNVGHQLADNSGQKMADNATNSLADGSLDGHEAFLADFAAAASYSIESPAGNNSQYDSLVAAAIESPAADSHYNSVVFAATPATKSMKSNVVPSEHNTRSKCNDHDIKRQKTEDNVSSWEHQYSDIRVEQKGKVLTLDVVLALEIRQYICVMWNYDATDINDIRNFCPGFLRRISNDKYEVMDDRDDICFSELSLDGDDGLCNLWGTYLKPPTKDFIDYCRGNRLFDGGYNRATHSEDIGHEVTPRRKSARDTAADNMNKAATKVYNRVKSKSGNVKVGDVVHIGIVPQDRGKVDPTNLTGVVVNINDHYGVCQVAVKSGLLRPWYVYHKLRVLVGKGNDRNLHDLEDTFQNWKKMDTVAPRTASTHQSLVGGQGIFQCKCKGKCSNNSCRCFKNNRKCTSACHRNNKCCENHDPVLLEG